MIRPVLKRKREGSYGLVVELEDGKQIPFSQFCRRPGPYFDFVNGLIEESQKSSKCCQFEQGSMMNTKLLIRSLSSMIGDEYPETLMITPIVVINNHVYVINNHGYVINNRLLPCFLL